MEHAITTRQPYSFDQTLVFIKRFPALHAGVSAGDSAVTGAITVGGRARAFTLRAKGKSIVADAPSKEVARRAADFIGADDDLRALYGAAEADPPFQALVRSLWGLHHVRFLGLEQIAVYSVLMQRTPMKLAVLYQQRFLEKLGHRVEVDGRTFYAMPELAELAELEADDIAGAIGHKPKAERIAQVTRGVAAIGEKFLREAPYEQAKQALIAIPGVGPFSAGAILLRGLGRMEELPSLEMFERDGRAVYGRAWKPQTIARRYGDQIGYWSFYLKTGAARLSSRTPSGSSPT
jgi:DNA-3-methyladenine glycosylase II